MRASTHTTDTVNPIFKHAEMQTANNGLQNNPSLIASKIIGDDHRYRVELMRSRFGSAVFFIFDAYTPITNGPLKGMPDCVFQTEDEYALHTKIETIIAT